MQYGLHVLPSEASLTLPWGGVPWLEGARHPWEADQCFSESALTPLERPPVSLVLLP